MTAINTQPLEVQNFATGITDYYLDGDGRFAKTMDNFFITQNAKLRTRWGSVAYGTQLPLGTARVNKLTQLSGVPLAMQDKRMYRLDSTWHEIHGTSGSFMPTGDASSVLVDSEWQSHLFMTSDAYSTPQKMYVDNTGSYKVVNAGLPALPSGMSITNPSGSGHAYLYTVVISSVYYVGTLAYLDRGPTYLYPSTVTGGAIDVGSTATITLPTAYSGAENWDTSTWTVEIYRTTNAGTVFYKVGEVPFGTSTFIDNVTDSTLQSNEQLYTTGGAAVNTPPPKAKFVHCVNGFGYWANVKEGTEIYEADVMQSKFSDPDSVPATFYASAEQPVKGLSSIYDRPILLCDRYIYRIDNYFSDDGTGGMILRRIDDKAGCVSQQSIVQTHAGLFWAGNTGFYWTDGMQVVCVSEHLNETYKLITATETRKKRICGTFDPSNQRVFWSVSIDDGTGEPDTVYVLDLKFPFNKTGVFTTMSGADFKPTQVLKVGNYLYRGDTRGYVFKHGVEYYTDPKVDTTKVPSLWGTSVIEHLYESGALDFGTKFYRKWVPRILISADNTTNLSLAISSSNDNNRVTGELKPIRYRNNINWGDTLPVWGDSTAKWNSQGMIEEWRRFPAGGLRCNYKQVILTNAEVVIVASTLLGTATVNPTANTATLGGSYTWLPDIVDYYISFSHDAYARKFKILSRTDTTIVYEDTESTDPQTTGLYDWKIVGKPKGEVLLLNGYVVHWALISKSHTPFTNEAQ